MFKCVGMWKGIEFCQDVKDKNNMYIQVANNYANRIYVDLETARFIYKFVRKNITEEVNSFKVINLIKSELKMNKLNYEVGC